MRTLTLLLISGALYSQTMNLGATYISQITDQGSCMSINGDIGQTIINGPVSGISSCTFTDPSGLVGDVSYNLAANSEAGMLGASASASLFVSTEAPYLGSAGGRASASVIENVFLADPSEASYLMLSGQLTGRATLNYTSPLNTNISLRPTGSTYISLVADTFEGAQRTLFEINESDTGFDQIIDETINFTIPFGISGMGRINASLETVAGCAFGGNCNANSDFLGTFLFTGGQLLDENMNAIQSLGLTSETGFDYLTGITDPIDPIDPPTTPVPEPATWLMLLGGLMFLRNSLRVSELSS